jgi:filamentous hemagglutinin family protein
VNQATDRAIIHWDTFSIGAGNTTTFVQPSSTSAVLNRVVTGAPSELLGTLNANGRVYLINPNGIMVGPSGVVNANRFVASTLDVANGDFLGTNGMVFGGNSTEKVINQGTINTGTGGAYLFSRQQLVREWIKKEPSMRSMLNLKQHGVILTLWLLIKQELSVLRS